MIDYDGINSFIDEGINGGEAFALTAFAEEFGHEPRTSWAICHVCRGEGGHSRRLGVVDPNEWDPDEWDDYMSGYYNARCERCDGAGKYREIDEGALSPEQAAWLCRYFDDLHESYDIQRQEMMFGA